MCTFCFVFRFRRQVNKQKVQILLCTHVDLLTEWYTKIVKSIPTKWTNRLTRARRDGVSHIPYEYRRVFCVNILKLHAIIHACHFTTFIHKHRSKTKQTTNRLICTNSFRWKKHFWNIDWLIWTMKNRKFWICRNQSQMTEWILNIVFMFHQFSTLIVFCSWKTNGTVNIN